MRIGIAIGVTSPGNAVGAAAGEPTVNFVTSFKVLGGPTTYNTSNPVGGKGRIPTNGCVVEVTVNNGATTCVPTNLLVTLRRKTWVGGAPGPDVDEVRVGRWHISGPYNEAAVLRPGGSTFHIMLDGMMYNANQVDSYGRTQNDQVVKVEFLAGFTAGSDAGLLPAPVPVQREDNAPWPIPNIRMASDPHQINDGTLEYEFGVVCRWARDGKPVDSVEAWAYSGGTDRADGASGGTSAIGPKYLATSTVFSKFTNSNSPTARYGQSALRARVYRVTIDKGSLPDTADPNNPRDGVIVRVCPHIGMDYTSVDIGDAWYTNGITPNLPKVLPMIINATGKYNRYFIWVNANRTAGASPAVVTNGSTADPGSAGSYGFWKLGIDAGIAANVARGHPAGSTTGLVIMLRDIAGSVRGANDNGAGGAGAYSPGGTSIWGSPSNYKGMFEVWRAGQWGTPLNLVLQSDLCRIRRVDATGTTIAGSTIAPKIRWVAANFDSTGTGDTAALNQAYVTDGSTNQTQQTYVQQNIHVFYRCRKEDNSRTAALAGACVPTDVGHIYEYEMEWTTAIAGQGHVRMAGMVVSVGSFYDVGAVSGHVRENAAVAPAGIFGVWILGGGFTGQLNNYPAVPTLKGAVLISVRCDAERSTTSVFGAVDRTNGSNPLGAGLCGVLFVRKSITAGYQGSFMSIWADNVIGQVRNYVLQHVMSVCAGNPGAARLNGPYNQSGAGYLEQDFVMQNSAPHSWIMKDSFFNDPMTPQTTPGVAAHNPANPYYQGDVTHDGNATPSLRVYRYARENMLAGVSWTDPAYWELITVATPTTRYGYQPDRGGPQKPRVGVDCRDNEVGYFSGASPGGESAESWFANNRRNGEIHVAGDIANDSSTWVVNDQSGNNAASFYDCGDYRPSQTGPLVNRVRAGGAVTSHDPFGTARKNDGTGAIGFLEAA